jgi:hypothetical protein
MTDEQFQELLIRLNAQTEIIAARLDQLESKLRLLHAEMKSNYVAFEGWARHFAESLK